METPNPLKEYVEAYKVQLNIAEFRSKNPPLNTNAPEGFDLISPYQFTGFVELITTSKEGKRYFTIRYRGREWW